MINKIILQNNSIYISEDKIDIYDKDSNCIIDGQFDIAYRSPDILERLEYLGIEKDMVIHILELNYNNEIYQYCKIRISKSNNDVSITIYDEETLDLIGTITDTYIAIEYNTVIELNMNDYVKFTDIVSDKKPGVAKIGNNKGISVDSDGDLIFEKPTRQTIDDRNNQSEESVNCPITASILDYAIGKSMTSNSVNLTDDEKYKAQSYIGVDVLKDDIIKYVDDLIGGVINGKY